jgi:hypothetical protein
MAEKETKLATKPATKPATKEDASAGQAEGEGREGWLSWVVGWVLVPATVIGLIFGGGVALGAHNHDGWFARTVVWVVDLF